MGKARLGGCVEDLFPGRDKICSPGETVLVHGCAEDLFPGRDCIYCSVVIIVML